ncbi:MAG: alpha-amylase [Planctomycetes bacterium]|nr:alpha-amylase [Planctomycetota bacterium]
MKSIRYPLLLQLNTRVWLTARAHQLGRPATLDDITGEDLQQIAEMGFDWIWLLSVWQTGPESQRVSKTNPEWLREFHEILPDLNGSDIGGSGFAISHYAVHRDLGGDEALRQLRDRMRDHGLKLMLDFVPNHMGLDHPWIEERPEYFIQGSPTNLANSPENFFERRNDETCVIFAHGRDPYFPGWPDTVQLDYSNPNLHAAMLQELVKISHQCDGLRCDMAMLILPDVFSSTWNRTIEPFWPAAIEVIRTRWPSFLFMAEVYWDRESELQQQGFDFTYDKRLYDRLLHGSPQSIRSHFRANVDFQNHMVRFLENHDEPRAATVFPFEKHKSAAAMAYLSPGMRLLHQGQVEGRRVKISPHLIRGPDETTSEPIHNFYNILLGILEQDLLRVGNWSLLECREAWVGNSSEESMIAFAWTYPNEPPLVVVTNWSSHASQCHIPLSVLESQIPGLATGLWQFHDRLDNRSFEWHGKDLVHKGLFVDLLPWQTSVFRIEREPA